MDVTKSYTITNKTLFHIASIERNLAIISQNEINVKNKPKVIQEVLFEDLNAINVSLKLNLTHGEVKKIVIGKQAESREAKLLFNVKQVFDFVKNNFNKSPIIFNFHLIQHIVKLLQSDLMEVWEVGKIRTFEEEIDRAFELKNIVLNEKNPINQLADHILWVEDEIMVHPLLKATVFMFEVNQKVPFTGLNYLSSLLFWRLIMEKYNYGLSFYIPLFKCLNVGKNDMTMLIDNALEDSSPTTVTEVITMMSEFVDLVIEDYKNKYIHNDINAMKTSLAQLDLNERQIKLLKLLQQKVSIKRREYIKLFKVSPMTAYRDLNYLVDNKLLVVSGQGKSTGYTLITQSQIELEG